MKIYLVKRDVDFELSEIRSVLSDEAKARKEALELEKEVSVEEAVVECWNVDGNFCWAECLIKTEWYRCGVILHLLDGRLVTRPIPKNLPEKIDLFFQRDPITFVRKDDEEGTPHYYQVDNKVKQTV